MAKENVRPSRDNVKRGHEERAPEERVPTEPGELLAYLGERLTALASRLNAASDIHDEVSVIAHLVERYDATGKLDRPPPHGMAEDQLLAYSRSMVVDKRHKLSVGIAGLAEDAAQLAALTGGR